MKRVEQLLARGNVRGLCRRLRHRNALVRRRAAQALGELSDGAAVPCLARAIRQDDDQYVRRWSIQALESIGTPEAVNALTEAMFSLRVQDARTADQSLRQLASPQAAAALRLRDLLFQHDWDALRRLDETEKRALAAILRSEGYASWPSARRRRLLELAVETNVTPPEQVSGELADLGLFVSEVHTLVDLLLGLFHRSPDVRASAARRVGDSGQGWTTPLLYWRFRRELKLDEERKIVSALARAMDRLDDTRALERLRERLHEGGQPAAEAAYLLAEVGTPNAIEILFDYAAKPPPPPAYRNVPLALSALQQVGPQAVDALAGRFDDPSAGVRRLMATILGRSAHPERRDRLAALARDTDETVQRAALEALAAENSAEAAQALYGLAGDVPEDTLAGALAAITHPAGPKLLRQLSADATLVYGRIHDDGRQPLRAAQVQILEERLAGDEETWQWLGVSARVETGEQGEFTLALPGWEGQNRLRLKVIIPATENRPHPETHTTNLPLIHRATNRVDAHIDRFFDRLAVDVEQVADPVD